MDSPSSFGSGKLTPRRRGNQLSRNFFHLSGKIQAVYRGFLLTACLFDMRIAGLSACKG
jgi:hypothetical protein